MGYSFKKQNLKFSLDLKEIEQSSNTYVQYHKI